MIREPILFRLFFSLLLLLSFFPFCTYEPTSQIHPNDVKVTFTSDTAVQSAMSKMVESYGDAAALATPQLLSDRVAAEVGMTADPSMNGVLAKDTMNDTGNYSYTLGDTSVDGKVITELGVFRVDGVTTMAAAERVAASRIDSDIISRLPATTFVDGSMKDGCKYADYSYTGTVNMISANTTLGTTHYYVAYSITRTTTVKTFEQPEA